MLVVPTDVTKDISKRYEELETKARNFNRSQSNNSDDYDEKHIKIRLSSENYLPLIKHLELPNIITVVRAAFMKITNTTS